MDYIPFFWLPITPEENRKRKPILEAMINLAIIAGTVTLARCNNVSYNSKISESGQNQADGNKQPDGINREQYYKK